jgi:hypothetical protein
MIGWIILGLFLFCLIMFITFHVLGSKEKDPQKKKDYDKVSYVFGAIMAFFILPP